MNCKPLFSILIANYNNGCYIQEAIDSVFEQTYSNWEVVIVDDGSTDGSLAIYNKYKEDNRIRVLFNGENKGCAYTKHQCVLHANGVYCGFLDPDDALLPNALEVSVQLLMAHPQAVLSFSRFYDCDKFMNVIGESRPLTLMEGESYFEHHDYRAEQFAGFTREAYMRMGGLDVSLKGGVDADLFFRLEEEGDVLISHEITYKYRHCPSSITANWARAFYWNLIIRHNTCIRRGLPVEKYSMRDFFEFSFGKSLEYTLLSVGEIVAKASVMD